MTALLIALTVWALCWVLGYTIEWAIFGREA